jgi:hypothetical protein
MTAIQYVGPHDEVEVEGMTVKRNGFIDVPAALAKSLREQEDWSQPKQSSDEAKSAEKNPPPPVDPATLPTDDEDPDPEPEPDPVVTDDEDDDQNDKES